MAARRSRLAEFGTWTPIGAVQVAGGGYDVAWQDPSSRPLHGVEHRQQRQLTCRT